MAKIRINGKAPQRVMSLGSRVKLRARDGKFAYAGGRKTARGKVRIRLGVSAKKYLKPGSRIRSKYRGRQSAEISMNRVSSGLSRSKAKRMTGESVTKKGISPINASRQNVNRILNGGGTWAERVGVGAAKLTNYVRRKPFEAAIDVALLAVGSGTLAKLGIDASLRAQKNAKK